MSINVFYADLDSINGKGVLVTGHGKGLVEKNSLINGKYIANDMVRLKIVSNTLFGYQGYIEQDNPKLIVIDYLIYFFDQFEKYQQVEPQLISIEEYLKLSKHNINMGEKISNEGNFLFHKAQNKVGSTYAEYSEILTQASKVKIYKVPFTDQQNERAIWVNNLIK